MRVEATATTMSWIPSESVWSPMRKAFELGLAHWDEPLPDTIAGPEDVHELCRQDKFRFANVLTGWAEVEDGAITGLDVEALTAEHSAAARRLVNA